MNNQQMPIRTGVMDFIQDTTRKQFVIPVYQRNYTWSAKKEVKKLLDDFDSLINNANENNHFIGMIMYIEKRISVRFSQLIVIDGQQRLTTIFLILLAIRKICKENNDIDNYDFINDSFILNTREQGENKLKLKPLINNDNTYRKLLEEKNYSLSEEEKKSKIYLNFEFCYDYFKKIGVKYTISEILENLNRLHMISIPLEDSDNPQQVFESINSTGVPLTAADLIRNYILMNNDNDTQEYLYKKYWSEIEKFEPESDKLQEIFRFYLAVKNKELNKKNEVYNAFKLYWDHSKLTIEERLKDILNYVRYHQMIYYLPSDNKMINESLTEFRKNQSKMPAPFLMEMYALYDNGSISDYTFSSLVEIINSYLIRRWLCVLDTSSVTRFFPTLLRSVINECNGEYSNIVEITKYYLVNQSRGKGHFVPTDLELEKSLLEKNAYTLRCVRTVLDRIENYDNSIKVNMDDLNIEHIMPQSPDKEGYWYSVTKLDPVEYDFYVNLIGNLTLCASVDNSKNGNKDFDSKKKVLMNTSHLKMNQDILSKDIWNQETILERTKSIAKMINIIYPYNYSTYVPLTDNIIYLTNSVDVKAIFHNQESIEVLSGSIMKSKGNSGSIPESYLTLFDTLLEEGVIEYDQDNPSYVVFLKNYTFSSVSYAAGFVLQGSRNGWDYFTHADGRSIEDLRNPSV